MNKYIEIIAMNDMCEVKEISQEEYVRLPTDIKENYADKEMKSVGEGFEYQLAVIDKDTYIKVLAGIYSCIKTIKNIILWSAIVAIVLIFINMFWK